MPKFLTRDEAYRVLQRELPEDVYPDAAPSGSFSTADNNSVAQCVASAYDNLEEVYLNYFPKTSDAKISDWEMKVFGRLAADSLSLSDRQDRVVNRIRFRRAITPAGVSGAILAAFPSLDFQLLEWGVGDGIWTLGVSELGYNTFLGMGPSLGRATGPDICDSDPADFGLTDDEWEDMQRQAYTYEVRIYNQTLTTAESDELDAVLTENEPARSDHFIRDGLSDSDKIGG